MPGLTIPPQELDRLERHAEAAYPREGCGLLFGEAATRHRQAVSVVRALPADNVHERPERRYRIAPEELLRAHKAARDEGLEIVGYYHSHPDRPAIPSATDREHAWPGTSYLIVSVVAGRVVDRRSWRFEAGSVEEETVREEQVDMHATAVAHGGAA